MVKSRPKMLEKSPFLLRLSYGDLLLCRHAPECRTSATDNAAIQLSVTGAPKSTKL